MKRRGNKEVDVPDALGFSVGDRVTTTDVTGKRCEYSIVSITEHRLVLRPRWWVRLWRWVKSWFTRGSR